MLTTGIEAQYERVLFDQKNKCGIKLEQHESDSKNEHVKWMKVYE